MKDIRVTKGFLREENCLGVYAEASSKLADSSPLALIGLVLGVIVGLLVGAAINLLEGINSHQVNATTWLVTLLFGLAGSILMCLTKPREPWRDRLRVVRKSLFGPTLDQLYSLYQEWELMKGISREERANQLGLIKKMMDEVWQESHKLLGLTIDEPTSLKTAEELMEKFAHIRQAIEELEATAPRLSAR